MKTLNGRTHRMVLRDNHYVPSEDFDSLLLRAKLDRGSLVKLAEMKGFNRIEVLAILDNAAPSLQHITS